MPTVAIFCAFPAMSATLSGCCVHLLLSMCTHTQFLHEYVYACVYLSLYIHIHIYNMCTCFYARGYYFIAINLAECFYR